VTCLGTLLLAPTANATWYKAKRPGLTVLIETEGHRITVLKLRYRQHCDDGSVRHVVEQRGNRRFNRRTGIFRWGSRATGNGFTSASKGHGTIYRRWAVGRFFAKDRETFGGEIVRCWTGASNQRPGVSFAARRL
jgi:hypothetical protein